MERVEMYDMANLDKRNTKLAVNIWVDSSHVGKTTSHNIPRIKIQVEPNNDNSTSNLVPVSISMNPQILAGKKPNISQRNLNEVFDFIKRNYDLLIKHWNSEISDIDLITQLRYVK